MKSILAFTALAITALPVAAQAPRELIARAVTAMGGEAALRALTGTAWTFNTATFAVGQEETPLSPARATFVSGRSVIDWSGNRRHTTQESRPVTGNPTRQRRVLADGLGFQAIDSGPAAYFGAPQVATEERNLRLSPERLLRSALETPASLLSVPPRTLRGMSSAGVRYASAPDTLNLYFDPLSGLLLATQQTTDDPILGDRVTTTWYTRWEDAGGLKLPRQVDVEANGRLLSHSVYPTVSVNQPVDGLLFAIPDREEAARLRAAAVPITGAITVRVETLAPGVWAVQGGSHHSVVVEQANQLYVLEGPQSSARTQAVLDTLKRRFPNKPVAWVINTHHHWDHSGGLRGYLAAGVPVITHHRNVDFVRGIAATRKTVAPDGLTRGGRAPEIRGVTDTLTIGSGDGRIQLFNVPTAHVEGMLMAYVPSAQLVFQSDLYGAGQAPNRVFLPQFIAAVKARGLKVAWVSGGHGGLVSKWEDVEKAAM